MTTTFKDIYKITKKLTAQEKGDYFEKYTLDLFKNDPRLNNQLEHIWLYKDIPKKYLNKLKLPKRDKGIDLIAIINGNYYSIQCKFRQNPEEVIRWNELATFFGLSFGMSTGIHRGILVTNTYNLCQEVINSECVDVIYGDFFETIPMSLMEDTKLEITPRDYQLECIKKTTKHLVDNDRCTIEMACGSGKTLTSYWIFRKLKSNKIIIFVPSLYLLSQFYSDWVYQAYNDDKNFNFLLIGSDYDVSDNVKTKANGIMLTTSVEEIEEFLNYDKYIIICTYQSSDKLIDAGGHTVFDLAFFDEAHKTVGQSGNKFSLALYDDKIVIERRIFMTATPKIYKGKSGDKKISMDNQELYGEYVYCYNTYDAINDGYLTDYQVLTIHAENNEINKIIKKNKLIKYKDKFTHQDPKYLAIILIILDKMNSGCIQHLVTYHNRVASAIKFSKFLEKINNILYNTDIFIDHLSGSDNMNSRNNSIREFTKSDFGILCTARVLNEGVNIPAIDSICFVDDRYSTIDIIQCIGRCLRLHHDKQKSIIIIPVISDDLESEDSSTIIRILKSLKNTDSRIVEYFRKYKFDKSNQHHILMHNVFCTELYSKEINLQEWKNDVNSKLWYNVDLFSLRFQELTNFIENNNRLPNRACADQSEKSLADWCNIKRREKKNNKLDNNKIKLFDSIHLWVWIEHDFFYEKYDELTKFIKDNNRLPKQNSKNDIEKSLALWCQRIKYHKKNNKLNADQIDMFNKLHLWTWNNSDIFNKKYHEVKKFIENNNKLPYQHSNDKYERSLGTWCSSKRYDYRNNKLDEDKICMLNQIDLWVWSRDDNFINKYNEVKQFVQKNHRLPKQNSADPYEKTLGLWCYSRRIDNRHFKLSDHQMRLLNDINGWFWDK